MSRIKNFLFNNTSVRQTALKNTVWLSIGQVGSRFLRAIVIILAARFLGAEGYGVFAYILGLAGLFTIFADVGVNQILTREVSKRPERAKRYFASAFGIKIFLITLTCFAVILVSPLFSNIEAAMALLPLAALLIVFDSLRDFANAYFRGREKMEIEALLTATSNIAITIFGVLALLKWQTAQAVTIAYVLSAGTGTLLGIYILRDNFFGFFKNFNRLLLRPILGASWPIALSSALGSFMLNVDIIMIGFFRGASDVGLYAASEKIVGVLYTFPALMAAALFPIIARFVAQRESEKTAEVMGRGMAAVFLIAAPISFGGLVLSSEILGFLYGAEYTVEKAVLAFQLLLITPLIIYPGAILKNYVLAHDKQIKLVPIIIAGVSANFLLNLLLIPAYGIIGSAVSTIISTALLYGWIWSLAKKTNFFSTLQRLHKIFASAILMALFAFLLKTTGTHFLINILFSATFYFVLLAVLREEIIGEIRRVLPI